MERLVAQSILSSPSSSAARSDCDRGDAGERGALGREPREQSGEQLPRPARGGLSGPAVGV